jgi:hypothetical protein
LPTFFYNMFRAHAAIFRCRHPYLNCWTVISLSRVWNALLFLTKCFKVHKNPGNLLIACCAHWLSIVGVLFCCSGVWVSLLVELFCSVCVLIAKLWALPCVTRRSYRDMGISH